MTISPPRILLNTSIEQYEAILEAAKRQGTTVESYVMNVVDVSLRGLQAQLAAVHGGQPVATPAVTPAPEPAPVQRSELPKLGITPRKPTAVKPAHDTEDIRSDSDGGAPAQ